MNWYIVVKAFLVIYTTEGPFLSKEVCEQTLSDYRVEYTAKYNRGERIKFLGRELSPTNVTASCKIK